MTHPPESEVLEALKWWEDQQACKTTRIDLGYICKTVGVLATALRQSREKIAALEAHCRHLERINALPTPRHREDIDRIAALEARLDECGKALTEARAREEGLEARVKDLLSREEYWIREAAKAKAETIEQARLNGKGSEREARLMAQIDEANRTHSALRAEELARLEAAEARVYELEAKLAVLSAPAAKDEKESKIAWTCEKHKTFGPSYLKCSHGLIDAPTTPPREEKP